MSETKYVVFTKDEAMALSTSMAFASGVLSIDPLTRHTAVHFAKTVNKINEQLGTPLMDLNRYFTEKELNR